MLPALLKPTGCAKWPIIFAHVQVMNASSMEAIIPAATSNSTVGPGGIQNAPGLSSYRFVGEFLMVTLGTKIVGQKSGDKTWDV